MVGFALKECFTRRLHRGRVAVTAVGIQYYSPIWGSLVRRLLTLDCAPTSSGHPQALSHFRGDQAKDTARHRHASERRKETGDKVSPELAFLSVPKAERQRKPPADVYYTQCTYERERQVSREAESKMTKYPEDRGPLFERAEEIPSYVKDDEEKGHSTKIVTSSRD